MQTLLHIGPHKTGTTYIQHQFEDHRQQLLDLGWLYPEVGCPPGAAAHHDLAHASDKYLERDTKPLAALREHGKNLVFSAEGLCNWGVPKFEKFASIVGGEKITLVYYIRDPFEVFYSYWKEEVKQGLVAGLPEKFMQHFNDPYRSKLLNPMVNINNYQKLGPQFELKLLPYDALMRNKLDIFQVLTSRAMGLETEFHPSGKRPNQALSIEVTEFLRVLTKDLQGAKGYPRKAVRYAFYKLGLKPLMASINEIFAKEMVPVRKACRLDRDSRFYRVTEKQLLDSYADKFLYLPEDKKIFPDGHMFYLYYDESDILASKALRPLYDDVRQRVVEAIDSSGASVHDDDLI